MIGKNEVKKDPSEVLWQSCLKWAQEKDSDFKQRCQEDLACKNISLKQLSLLPMREINTSISPFSRLTMPLSGIRRLFGMTPYLAEELQLWGNNSEKWLRSCNVTRASVLLIADGFEGEGPAWGVLAGAEALESTVITLSDKPWNIVNEYGITACALTTGMLKTWVDSGVNSGICSSFFCLSNDLTDNQRSMWQEKLGAPIYRQIGLPGVQSSVIAWECLKQAGYHWPIDLFWPEIIDTRMQTILPTSETGELVLTALRRRSTTGIRVRTSWYGHFTEEICDCGSPFPRFILEKMNF